MELIHCYHAFISHAILVLAFIFINSSVFILVNLLSIFISFIINHLQFIAFIEYLIQIESSEHYLEIMIAFNHLALYVQFSDIWSEVELWPNE